ncbi:MAG: hypothetical protein U1A78_16800 [Polyangia bacterium]
MLRDLPLAVDDGQQVEVRQVAGLFVLDLLAAGVAAEQDQLVDRGAAAEQLRDGVKLGLLVRGEVVKGGLHAAGWERSTGRAPGTSRIRAESPKEQPNAPIDARAEQGGASVDRTQLGA